MGSSRRCVTTHGSCDVRLDCSAENVGWTRWGHDTGVLFISHDLIMLDRWRTKPNPSPLRFLRHRIDDIVGCNAGKQASGRTFCSMTMPDTTRNINLSLWPFRWKLFYDIDIEIAADLFGVWAELWIEFSCAERFKKNTEKVLRNARIPQIRTDIQCSL